MAKNEEEIRSGDSLFNLSNFKSSVGPISNPIYKDGKLILSNKKTSYEWNTPPLILTWAWSINLDSSNLNPDSINLIETEKKPFSLFRWSNMWESMDKAKETNKSYRNSIYELKLEKWDDVSYQDILNIEDKYKPEWFKDNFTHIIWNTLLSTNNSVDSIKETDVKKIRDIYKSEWINTWDFTNKIKNLFQSWDNQIKSDIDSAIKAEADYMRLLTNNSTLTEQNLNDYDYYNKILNETDIPAKIIADDYSFMEWYQEMVNYYWENLAKEKIKKDNDEYIKEILLLNEFVKKIWNTIDWLNDTFKVDVSWIWSWTFVDKSKTDITWKELLLKINKLKDVNDKAIEAATWMNRDEYNKVNEIADRNTEIWSFDLITTNALKESKEVKDQMIQYEYLWWSERSTKQSEIIQEIITKNTFDSIENNISDIDQKNSVSQIKNNYLDAKQTLNRFNDNVSRTYYSKVSQWLYPDLPEKEWKEEVTELLFNQLEDSEKRLIRQWLDTVSYSSAFMQIARWKDNMSSWLKEMDIAKAALWTWNFLSWFTAVAFETWWEIIESWIKKDDKLLWDVKSYNSWYINANEWIVESMKNIATNDLDAVITGIWSILLNPNKTSVLKSWSYIWRLNQVNSQLEAIQETYNKTSKTSKVINKLITWKKLNSREQNIVNKNTQILNLSKERYDIVNNTKYISEVSKSKDFIDWKDTENIIEKMRFFNETNSLANKTTKFIWFQTDSILTWFRADAGINQALWVTVDDQVVKEDFFFNIIWDTIMWSVALWFWKKLFKHDQEVSDIMKTLPWNKELSEWINLIQRRMYDLNGWIVISKSETLNILKSSMSVLGSFSSKSARLDNFDNIIKFTDDVLWMSPKSSNSVTDSWIIISFNDNLSKFIDQNKRLSYFNDLYNKALSSKSPSKSKNVNFYKAKIEQELNLIEALSASVAKKEKLLSKFKQNKSSYMWWTLNIESKNLQAEIYKSLDIKINKLKKNLKWNKKVDTKDLMNYLEETISEYDESFKGWRKITMYDTYTWQEIIIDEKQYIIQSKALSEREWISLNEAKEKILKSWWMSINMDMVYADIKDWLWNYKRIYWFSDKQLIKTIENNYGIKISSLDITTTKEINKIQNFTEWNSKASKVNKDFWSTIEISHQSKTKFNASFSKWSFDIKKIKEYISSYSDESNPLNIKKWVEELNKEISKLIDDVEVTEAMIISKIESNTPRLLLSWSTIFSINTKELLSSNSEFKLMDEAAQESIWIKLNNIISWFEVKYYNDILQKELWDSVVWKTTSLWHWSKPYKEVLKETSLGNKLITLTHWSTFKHHDDNWNEIIYIMPSGWLKNKKEFSLSYKNAVVNMDKKMSATAVFKPLREYALSVITDLWRIKEYRWINDNLATYYDIASEDNKFNYLSYINDLFKDSSKQGSKNIEEVKSIISYLKNNILDGWETEIDIAITKNFIHNLFLNKKWVDSFIQNYSATDNNALALRNILLSDTSLTWIINKKTSNAIEKADNKIIEDLIKKTYNEEKFKFDSISTLSQSEINNLRLRIKKARDDNSSASTLLELNNKLKTLIGYKSKEKFISFSDYRKNNIGIALYQDFYNKVQSKIINDANKFTHQSINKRKAEAKKLIKLNKLSVKERNRIAKELQAYSDLWDNLDITKQIEKLYLNKSKANVVIKEHRKALKALENTLGSNVSDDEKYRLMDDYMMLNQKELDDMYILLNKIDSIVVPWKPKKPKESNLKDFPEQVYLDVSDNDLKSLRSELVKTISNIEKSFNKIREIDSLKETNSFKYSIEEIKKVSEEIEELKLTNESFNDLYSSIKVHIDNGSDIKDLRFQNTAADEITYVINWNTETISFWWNLSPKQVDALTSILRKIEKNNAWVTWLKLDIEEISSIWDDILQESEVSTVIYKDITDSLFLNYTLRDEHSIIDSAFKDAYSKNVDWVQNFSWRELMWMLYKKEWSDFRKFIDSLYVTDISKIESYSKKFEVFLEDILKNSEYSYRWIDWVITTLKWKDIIPLIDIKKLKNRFANIRNQDNGEAVLKMSSWINSKWFLEFEYWSTQFLDLPIIYRNIKESKWTSISKNLRYIDWFSIKNLSRFMKTADSIKFMKKEQRVIFDELTKKNYIWIINWTDFPENFSSGWKKIWWYWLSQKLRSNLKLQEWEILGLWFWNKDGFTFVYKNTDIDFSWVSYQDRMKITELAYFYDMWINAWFINIDISEARNLWKSFIKDFNSSSKKDFDSFQKYLFEYKWKKSKLKLTDIMSGSKPDKDLTDFESWKKSFKSSSDNIKKRLSSSSSTKNLFQWYKWEKAIYDWDISSYLKSNWLKTVIIDEVKEDWLLSIMAQWKNNKEKISLFKEYANNPERLWNIDKIINKPMDDWSELTDEYILKRIDRYYLSDYEDGTWYATRDIWKINKLINNWSDTIIKTHIQWTSENWKVNLWKWLINTFNIKHNWSDLSETLIIWKWMHKIKWDYLDLSSEKHTIEINWKMYNVIWIDDNVDYSYFKEATSTSAKTKEMVSIDSIIWAFDQIYVDAFHDLTKNKITDLVKNFEKTYISDGELPSLYWDLNRIIKKLYETRDEIQYSDQYFKNKFNQLFSDIKNVIEETRTEWYWFKSFKLDPNLHPDTVKIHPENPLYKKIEKEFEWDNKYIVITRAPVSDRYVSGLYKIVLDDTMDKKHIKVHPETGLDKLRLDHDGDTVTAYNPKKEYGSILTRAVYWNAQLLSPNDIVDGKKLIDMNDDEFFTHIDNNYDFENWVRLNDYIEAKEVDELTGEVSNEYTSFISKTLIAQQADKDISIWASSVRTADIMNRSVQRIVRAWSNKANIEFSKLNPDVQRAILKWYLWKDIHDIHIYESIISWDQSKFIDQLNKEWMPWGKYFIDGKNKYSITRMFNEIKSKAWKEIFLKKVKYNLTNNKWITLPLGTSIRQINLEHRKLSNFRLTQEDLEKLSLVKQDKRFAVEWWEVLNTFFDFAKSWKDFIPEDFDRKMVELMFPWVDYEKISPYLENISKWNKVQWKYWVNITDPQFQRILSDDVSWDISSLWKFAHDSLNDYLKIQAASNEIPFLLKKYKEYLSPEEINTFDEIFYNKWLDVWSQKVINSIIENNKSISEIMFAKTWSHIDSISYLTNKQKENLYEHIKNKIPKEIKDTYIEISTYQDLKKNTKKFFNQVLKLREKWTDEDIIYMTLFIKTLSADFNKTMKTHNTNNVSIQNTMNDNIIKQYIESTVWVKESIIKNSFKNLDIDTKNEYLEKLSYISDNLNKQIQKKNTYISEIKDKFKISSQDLDIEYQDNVKLLDESYNDLLNKSLELEKMNQSKKSYFIKKEKYDSDLKKYYDSKKELEKTYSLNKREVKEYEDMILEISRIKIEESNLIKEAQSILWTTTSSKEDIAKLLKDRIGELDANIERWSDEFLLELKLWQENIILDWDSYKIISWDETKSYKRVSDYTNAKFIAKDKKLLKYSSDIWRWAEALIRDVFNNKKKVNLLDYPGLKTFKTEKSFKEFISEIKRLREDFSKKWEVLYSKDIKVKDDVLWLAWEVNLVTKTKDGKYKLYDIKTVRDTSFYDLNVSKINENKWNQLSMYSNIIERNYKIDSNPVVIDEINVIIFKANYDEWINSISYSEIIPINKKNSVSEINDDLLSNWIINTEEILSPSLWYDEKIKTISRYIQNTNTQIKSLNKQIDKKELKMSETLVEIWNIIKKDLSNINPRNVLDYKNSDIKELLARKNKVDELYREVDALEGVTTTKTKMKALVKKKWWMLVQSDIKSPIIWDIKDSYAWWSWKMSEEIINDLKWVTDTYKKMWDFQYIDQIQRLDPEFLNRINAISFHMWNDFKVFNKAATQWDSIISELDKWLADINISWIWKIKQTFNLIKSKITPNSDSSHNIWRKLKESINQALIWEWGEIIFSLEKMKKLFKEKIVSLNQTNLVYDEFIWNDKELISMLSLAFPDLKKSELTVWHIHYIYLSQNKKLNTNIDTYINETVSYSVAKLNTLDSVVWEPLQLLQKYSGSNSPNRSFWWKENQHSSLLLDDIIESAKWDHNLAIISLGISNIDDFKKRLMDKWFTENQALTLYSELYKKDNSTGQRFFDLLNGINYMIKYWYANTLHYAGTISATIQMPWQYTEIMTRKWSFWWISDIEISKIRANTKVMKWEDTHIFASGIALQNNDNPFANFWSDFISNQFFKLDNFIEKKYGIDTGLWMKVRWTIDLFTNPLWKQDAPFDNIRKDAAIKQAMFESWYKTYEDLILSVDKFWKWEMIRFETKARMIYNELWGWVSSKDSLYKINKLFNLHWYSNKEDMSWFAAMAMRSWQNLWGYLAHWMANKTMRNVEIIQKLTRAAAHGDLEAIWQLTRVSLSRARNIAYIATMWLKYDKLQDIDTTKRDWPLALVTTLANDVVWVLAFTWFAIQAHERSILMDAWLWEESLIMLQSFTWRFTGSLNVVPNLIDSLYSQLVLKNWNKMSIWEKNLFIIEAVMQTIKDNGWNFNRYSWVNKSEYWEWNIWFSYSSITWQWVWWQKWKIDSDLWLDNSTQKDIIALRSEWWIPYLKHISKALIWDRLFKNNVTYENRLSAEQYVSLRSSIALKEIDDAMLWLSDTNWVFNVLHWDRYSNPEDIITFKVQWKDKEVHRNDVILMNAFNSYYFANGKLWLEKLNPDGSKNWVTDKEEAARRNIMKDTFWDLSIPYNIYIENWWVQKFDQWVYERIVSMWLNSEEWNIMLWEHEVAIPEITDYIIDNEFSNKKKQYLIDTYWKDHYYKWYDYDDIPDVEEMIMKINIYKNMPELISLDRWIKRVADGVALYLDETIQESVYKSSWAYLPIMWKDEDNEMFDQDNMLLTWQVDVDKYPQSKESHKVWYRIKQRLENKLKEDDLTEYMISKWETWELSSSLKVLSNTSRDAWTLTKTFDKIKSRMTDKEFANFNLQFLDSMNSNIAKKLHWSKFMENLKESWLVSEYVNYMYAITDSIKDYDPEESWTGKSWDYIWSSFNWFSRYTWQNQWYKWNYWTFSNGQWLASEYQPIIKYVNDNRDMLYDNPHKVIQSYIADIPFIPTRAWLKIADYILPRIKELKISPSWNVIKETGGSIYVKDNVTYKKIKKISKIRVRQSKVRSRIKYSRKTKNLLSGLVYGKQDF